MIEKITDYESLSGVSSPLLPLIYTDGFFSQNDLNGAFLQKSENGGIQAAFSLKNTCVTLHLISDEGIDEIEKFFSFCGVTEILSDKSLDRVSEKQKQLHLLEFKGNFPQETVSIPMNQKSTISEYKNIYDVVFSYGNNFENWFPEFSKKINSGYAQAMYLTVDNETVSCAVAPAVYKDSAIIAGVFTLEKYRNKGYASACVKGLLRELLIKNISKIYLWCEEVNIGFYEKLGFVKKGKIFIGE